MNFKKRVNGSWTDTPHYIHNTSTDTITTLPAVIYPTGTTATVELKGQTVQSSVPSPTSPVMPEGCGDLETVGTKAGQYKIPISSASATTPVYLGEVQTTRKVKKLVLTGQEAYTKQSGATLYSHNLLSGEKAQARDLIMCSHLPFSWSYSTTISIHIYSSLTTIFLNFGTDVMNAQPSGNTVEGLKEYLAAQYTAGTPVTIWYVLATPTTGIVNEPLMRIGDYADTLSNISIPVTAGGDTLSVGTTVQPSEITVNYKGWHPVADVHEFTNGAWT